MTDAHLHQQVTDVLVRYATGIDTRDWKLLRTCFTEDCFADYGDIGVWRSGDEITDWMAATHDPLGPSMHQLSNITVQGTGPQATSRAYVHAIIVPADRGPAIHAFGWYDDELVDSGDGWRIARRHFTQAAVEVHPPAG